MSNATINDPMPHPDGIAEVHKQRREALAEFVSSRDMHHRREKAKADSYARLVQFLTKNRKDFSSPAQEFIDAWTEEHAAIEASSVASATALQMAQYAVYSKQNGATAIFNKYANSIEAARRKASEPNRDHVFENSKLAKLLIVLKAFSERKSTRKASK